MARPLQFPILHFHLTKSLLCVTISSSPLCCGWPLVLGSAGLRPGSRGPMLRQQDTKPFSPRSVPFNRADADHGEADQLAGLRQGPLLCLASARLAAISFFINPTRKSHGFQVWGCMVSRSPCKYFYSQKEGLGRNPEGRGI
jgi:hypothetical protein